MAVALPAGQHEVIYYYRNHLLTQVLFLLCAIAWLALLGLAIFAGRLSNTETKQGGEHERGERPLV